MIINMFQQQYLLLLMILKVCEDNLKLTTLLQYPFLLQLLLREKTVKYDNEIEN